MNSLFEDSSSYQPLASRVRPANLSDYVGQRHLLAENRPLGKAMDSQALHSMILWGPPGVGKTTFARLLSSHFDVEFSTVSAVLGGVKDIRAAVEQAKIARASTGKNTLLFVDEVHRFNKAQQDAFLPFIEDGTIYFIGATTENPSFELNNALLSRARTYVLRALEEGELLQLINNALVHPDGFPDLEVELSNELRAALAKSANGDGRRVLNFLELAVDLSPVDKEGVCRVSRAVIEEVIQSSLKRFDKGGDIFYEQISALHKSVRGSDPDAALYWFVRMLDGGCDPLYVARRLVRMASEDIGNADPRALSLAVSAWDVQTRLGSPEGELSLAQALVYLAVAPKSNAVYQAYNRCKKAIAESPDLDVPMHLRNAPTSLMKEQGMGDSYRYAHDEPNAFAAGENYFPEMIKNSSFYHPVDRGLEIKIAEKLASLRSANLNAVNKRYTD